MLLDEFARLSVAESLLTWGILQTTTPCSMVIRFSAGPHHSAKP